MQVYAKNEDVLRRPRSLVIRVKMNLKKFFQPKRIAVVGVSRNPNKVGHVIFKNIIDGEFEGEVIPINPNTKQIFHHRVYNSISVVRKKVDLAIIAIPAKFVLGVVKQCQRKGIKHVLVISAGFKEVGNVALESELKSFLDKHDMKCVGK